MNFDARWALPLYPVLKAQSHEKSVKKSYKNKNTAKKIPEKTQMHFRQ